MFKNYILIYLIFMSLNVFSHGENKPGPHGGHVQMPGNFHTELVLEGKTAKVYLLDINFKNLNTINSIISLSISSHKGVEEIACIDKKSYYECTLSDQLSNYTIIKIKTFRKGFKEKEAVYNLPLSFSKSDLQKPSAMKHHH